MKDWDAICKSIKTPPDSDEEDGLNILSVKKNAQKVSDILHHALPMLNSTLASGLPKGMNNMASFSSPLKSAIDATKKVSVDHSREPVGEVCESASFSGRRRGESSVHSEDTSNRS